MSVVSEAILLLLHAWNSVLVPGPGTNLSQSLLVEVGREFAFPIDYSTSKYFKFRHHKLALNLLLWTKPS